MHGSALRRRRSFHQSYHGTRLPNHALPAIHRQGLFGGAVIYKKQFSEGRYVEVMTPLTVDVGVFKDLEGATTWLNGRE